MTLRRPKLSGALALVVAASVSGCAASSSGPREALESAAPSEWVPAPDDPRRYSVAAWDDTFVLEVRQSEPRWGASTLRAYREHTLCADLPASFPGHLRYVDFERGTARVHDSPLVEHFPLEEKTALAERREAGLTTPPVLVMAGSAAYDEAGSAAAASALSAARAQRAADDLSARYGDRYDIVIEPLGWDGFAALDASGSVIHYGAVLFFDEIPTEKLSRIRAVPPLSHATGADLTRRIRAAHEVLGGSYCAGFARHQSRLRFTAGDVHVEIMSGCLTEQDARSREVAELLAPVVDAAREVCGTR